jgi:hypothetical protein
MNNSMALVNAYAEKISLEKRKVECGVTINRLHPDYDSKLIAFLSEQEREAREKLACLYERYPALRRY